MSQTIAAGVELGPGYTGLAVGYRILNLDRTVSVAFTTTGVSESAVAGTYTKNGGVVAPDAGGYIVWGVSGTDYIEAAIPPSVTAALNSYDPPTKAELDAAQAALTAFMSALGLAPVASGPLPNVAGALSIVAATTFSATLSGLSIASSWTAVRFTIKRGNSRTDADSTSILQIVKSNPGVGSDGLAIINGAAGTAAQASLTVNQAAGTVAIRIEDDATVKLEPTTYMYDLKVFYGSSESLAYQGSIAVLATATQTV